MKKYFSLLLLCFFTYWANAQSVVISQVYGGGGNSGSVYRNDFIELFNPTTNPVSLTGWSVQYASATGSTWQVTNLTNFTLQPGQYYLIQQAQGTGGTTNLPTPDAIGTIAMSGTAGKVALVNSTTALTGSCPTVGVIDFVGFGVTANCFEGSGPTPAPSNSNSVFRNNNGCTDNNDNANDFTAGLANPRNSASTLNPCGGATPSLNISSPLASFGNVCINTTAGPNSFTISGSNLTTANVAVAALTGFEYATASGGPYSTTLSLTQPGGSFSQQVFVRFTPTAVQSYNGNIAVSGGGVTTPVNAAAVGSGVNTAPSVTTGGASSITLNSATAAGSIPATGCTSISAYGIEYSTTAGFPNGSGIQVASSNLSGGNFSSSLTGLASGTPYYYKAYATNAGGTTYGAEQTFTTLTPNPTITTSALSAFGNVCINTTAGPNSFTITGSNLTTANVTVGPLTGYTYSTTAGGTYTASLSLTQPGGSYSQQIFVRFTPTAVQSYNGNVPVDGGGIAAPVNVAAAGSGVNTTASVTTGAASAITQTTATAAGSITATGCSSVTAYGIEYSTTNNFPLGTGTQVASSNLSGGNFSAGLTGLTASTTYYYRAYATNAGGTAYGSQLSFTTAAPTLTASALVPFGNICINTTSAANSFIITGVGLTNANVNVGPLAGYTFSTTSGGTYTASLSLTQPGGAFSQTIYVKLSPILVQAYTGNIPVSGGGAASTSVAADGNGVNTLATVVTGASANITNHSATLAGSIAATGCSNVTEYGIEFSGINGFGNGTGTKVVSANLNSGNYTAALSGLVQGATYYYKAYATNNGGTSYGLQQSFTVASIADGFSIYPAPAQRGGSIRVTKNDLKPGYYGLLFFNSSGQLVYQNNINIQADFINQSITLPGSLMSGAYRVILVNNDDVIATRTIHIF